MPIARRIPTIKRNGKVTDPVVADPVVAEPHYDEDGFSDTDLSPTQVNTEEDEYPEEDLEATQPLPGLPPTTDDLETTQPLPDLSPITNDNLEATQPINENTDEVKDTSKSKKTRSKPKAPKVPKERTNVPKFSTKQKAAINLVEAASEQCLNPEELREFKQFFGRIKGYILNAPKEVQSIAVLEKKFDGNKEEAKKEHNKQYKKYIEAYPKMEPKPKTALALYKENFPKAKKPDFEASENREEYETKARELLVDYYERHSELKKPTSLVGKKPPSAFALYKADNPDTKMTAKEFAEYDNSPEYEARAYEMLKEWYFKAEPEKLPPGLKNGTKNRFKEIICEDDYTPAAIFKRSGQEGAYKDQPKEVTVEFEEKSKKRIESYKTKYADYFMENPDYIRTPFVLWTMGVENDYLEKYKADYFVKMVENWNNFIKSGNGTTEMDKAMKRAKKYYQFQFAGLENNPVTEEGCPITDDDADTNE